MTKQTERKRQTRQRMLDAASRSFKSHGFAGVGVDSIAKAAGATSGAFYAHMGSKDQAFLRAVETGLDEVIKAVPVFQEKNGDRWIEAFVNYYLGKAHRDDRACGCAMTSLSPEVTRANPQIKQAYETRMNTIVDEMANGLPGETASERQSKAWGFIGLLTGGLTMSRAVGSDQQAKEIAEAVKLAALAMVN